MTEYATLVREEVVATIDRAEFEHLNSDAISIDVTDSFQRRLGECRLLHPADSKPNDGQYEIRIARRLFEDGNDD